MGLSLPLSPAVTGNVETTLDCQRALFQASTFTDIQQVSPALHGLDETLRPQREALETTPSGRKRELRHFNGLQTDNETSVRLALAELAASPAALQSLVKAPRVLQELGDAAKDLRLDVSETQRQHQEWIANPREENAPELTPFGQFSYWLGNVVAPKNWLAWGSGGSLLAEAAYWAATGQPPTAALAASSSLLAGALYGLAHRHAAKTGLLRAAETGPLNHEMVRSFFESYNRLIPRSRFRGEHPSYTDVIESIRRSAAAGGTPLRRRATTFQVAADFLNLGSAAAMSFDRDPSGKIYDLMAQAIGLGTFSRIHWQPMIFNTHILQKVEELRSQGKRVLFVGNHRSHLDILLAVSLLRDFGVRFVAKASLGKVPVLKDLLHRANHFLVSEAPGAGRLSKVAEWGTEVFEKGLSPFFFLEGTRLDTPVGTEEVGMGPPEIGAAHLAARFPRDTYIVPIVSYGFGLMLRKDDKKALKEGTNLYQPTVTALLDPIDVSTIMDENPELSLDEERRLNSLLWGRMWGALSEIQAYMNDLATKG